MPHTLSVFYTNIINVGLEKTTRQLDCGINLDRELLEEFIRDNITCEKETVTFFC